jgi:hypothetical protein
VKPVESGTTEVAAEVKRPWWRSVIYYYTRSWKTMLVVWLVFTVGSIGFWQFTILPVSYDGVQVTGNVTSIGCGRSGYDYTYAYLVSGLRYTGDSSSGDGNDLNCHLPHKPQQAQVVYSARSPGTSIGGTLIGRKDTLLRLLEYMPLMGFLLWGPFSFAEEQRDRRDRKRAFERDSQRDARLAPSLPESRQQRRARERRASRSKSP